MMSKPALVDNEISQTILMPFENGDIASVSLSLYKAPKGQSRPIDAYVVTECEGDFTGAARRAAEAVYNLAQKKLPRIGQMVIGLDIQGLSPGSAPVTGESGGLSFAIAIAGELFKKKIPIAATGVVSSRVNGKVDRVEGIVKKLTAAAEIIPQQGRILYPTDNHDEIPESVFRLARDKRITLHPVATIAEAIYAAYGIEIDNGKTKYRLSFKEISAAVIIVVAAITLGTAFFLNKDRQKTVSHEQAISADKTKPPILAESPIVTPPPITAADKENTETEKLSDQNVQSSSRPKTQLVAPPAPASSEPFYPEAGFE